MPLSILTPEQSIEWDKLIKSFSKYDVYYLSGYVKAFEINGDGTPLLFYFEDENIKAINVVMFRDISDDKHFAYTLKPHTLYDIATPYGYGGWIIEQKNNSPLNTDDLDKQYTQYCKEHNIISEFVRFHPFNKSWSQINSMYDTAFLGNTIAIDTSDKDIIMNNFDSKNRNQIRKAEKSGVTVNISDSKDLIPVFKNIYDQTMTDDNASEYYFFDKKFYESVFDDLKGNAHWFVAEKDSKIIAMSIILNSDKYAHYHLSASIRDYRSFNPTNLILYKAALWANERGYKKLHLGGGVGSGEDSLFKFKRAFNRSSCEDFYIGKKIFDNDVYHKLVDIRKTQDDFDAGSGFFPLYRA